MSPDRIDESLRQQMVNETMQAFVELILTEKFADMPSWMELDLTVSQVRAIYSLGFKHSMTVSELAKHIGISNPAASILVQQLVQQELVERSEDPGDRRRMLVNLTARGAEMISGRREVKEAKFRRRMSQIDDGDLLCLQRGLKALVDIVREEKQDILSSQ